MITLPPNRFTLSETSHRGSKLWIHKKGIDAGVIREAFNHATDYSQEGEEKIQALKAALGECMGIEQRSVFLQPVNPGKTDDASLNDKGFYVWFRKNKGTTKKTEDSQQGETNGKENRETEEEYKGGLDRNTFGVIRCVNDDTNFYCVQLGNDGEMVMASSLGVNTFSTQFRETSWMGMV
jgi:hypothetical protein